MYCTVLLPPGVNPIAVNTHTHTHIYIYIRMSIRWLPTRRGPPAWALGVVLKPPHSKNWLCYESWSLCGPLTCFSRATTFDLPPVRIKGRRSSAGITTRYRLEGRGIEYRCGVRFSTPVQTGPGTHPAFYTVVTRSLGVKVVGAWRWPPTPTKTEVEERIKLYVYSLSGPS
jgi:hypothetical protein